MEAMRQITDQLLEGVIRSTISPYASPVFLVCCPDKKPRLVIVYRILNKNIEIEAQPLPNTHLFSVVLGSKIFQCFGLVQRIFSDTLFTKVHTNHRFCLALWPI